MIKYNTLLLTSSGENVHYRDELGTYGAVASTSSANCELTHIKTGREAAAGDTEVVGVLLSEQEPHVRVPEFDVSVGAAAHEHLVAGRKAAGHHAGLAGRAASGNNRQQNFGEGCSTSCCRAGSFREEGGELFRTN